MPENRCLYCRGKALFVQLEDSGPRSVAIAPPIQIAVMPPVSSEDVALRISNAQPMSGEKVKAVTVNVVREEERGNDFIS